MSAILQNSDTLKKTMDDAMTSQGSAMEEHGKQMESITSHINTMKVAWEQLSSNTLSSGFVIGIVDAITALIKLIDAVGGTNIAFAGLIATINAVTKNGFLESIWSSINTLMGEITAEVDRTTDSVDRLGSAGKIAGSALKGFGVAFIASFAIEGAIKLFDSLHTSLEEQAEVVANLSGEYNALKTSIESLERKDVKTPKEQEQLELLQKQLEIKEEILNIEKKKEASQSMKSGLIRTRLDFQAEDKVKNKLQPNTEELSSLVAKYSQEEQKAKELQEQIKNLDSTTSSYELTLATLEKRLLRTNDGMNETKDSIQKTQDAMTKDIDTLLSVKEKLLSAQPHLSGDEKDRSVNAVKLINNAIKQAEVERDIAKALFEVKNATDEVVKANNSMSDTMDNVSVDAEDINNSMSKLQKSFDIVDSAQKEFSKSGKLSVGTLDSIRGQFGSMEGSVADYNSGLKSGAELIADLTKVYDNDVDAYNTLVSEKRGMSENFYSSLSESEAKSINDLAEKYGVDTSNFTTLVSVKQSLWNGMLNTMGINNAETINKFKEAYDVDLLNFNELMKKKTELTRSFILANSFTDEQLNHQIENDRHARSNASQLVAVKNTRKELAQVESLLGELEKGAKGTFTSASFNSPSGGGGKKDKSSKSDYGQYMEVGVDDIIKDIESAEDDIVKQINQTQANIDQAIVTGDNKTELSLQKNLANHYAEQAKINEEMVKKLQNEQLYWANTLAKNNYSTLKGIDIGSITEKQLSDVMREYEKLIASAKGDDKRVAELEKERDKISEFAGGIIEARELISEKTVTALELENQALEENIKLIERKAGIKQQQLDKEFIDIEQEQLLYDDDSAEYYQLEVKKHDKIVEMQQNVFNQINKLRQQGLLDTSDEIIALKQQWEEYETDRLTVIKDARDKQKELEEKYDDDRKSLEKKLQDALTDALKDGVEKRKKELDKELKAHNKAIDEQLKKLDREYDEEDYEAKEKEQAENILKIQEEIDKYKLASASGDMEAKTKVAELEKKLKEEEKKLTEMQKEREKELRKDNLNDMKDKAEEETEKAKEELDNQYEDKKEQIQNMTDLVGMGHDEWTSIIEGFYEDIGTSANDYKSKLEELKEEVNGLAEAHEKISNISTSVPSYDKDASDKYDPDDTNNPNNKPMTEDEAKKKAQLNESKYLKKLADEAKSTGNEGLYAHVLAEREKWNISPDGTVGDIGGIDSKMWDDIKHKWGFYRGGETNGTGWHWLDGEPNKPERVLSSEQTKAFNKLVDYAPMLTGYLEKMFSNITNNNQSVVELKIENLVNIEGNVADDSTVNKITNATNEVLTNINNAFKRRGLSF